MRGAVRGACQRHTSTLDQATTSLGSVARRSLLLNLRSCVPPSRRPTMLHVPAWCDVVCALVAAVLGVPGFLEHGRVGTPH